MMLFIVFFLYLLYLKLYYLLAFFGSSTRYIFSIFCTRRFLFSRPLSTTLLKYSIIVSCSLFTRSSFCRFRNFLLFFDIFFFYFSNFSLGFYIFTNIRILDNGNIVGRFCVWFYILFFNWIAFLSPYSRNDDGWYGILGTNLSKKWICLNFKTNYRYSLIL